MLMINMMTGITLIDKMILSMMTIAKMMIAEMIMISDRVYKRKDSYTLYEGLTKPIRWSCES